MAIGVDGGFLTPLALALRWQSAGLWIAIVLTLLLGMAIPWLLGKRPKISSEESVAEGAPVVKAYQTVVTESRCHACTQCYQDCPFDAIQMIPRSDGSALKVRAWVDPERCVGCAVCVGSCDSEAMRLPIFDIESQEDSMRQRAEARLGAGEPVWIAFVSADSEGGVPYFQKAIWEQRLPGYQVEVIPTASWLRPKWLERLFKAGVSGILIVRDGRKDLAQARDGNLWIGERIAGQRSPAFRPQRAGGQAKFELVDYVPGQLRSLQEVSRQFRQGIEKGEAPAKPILRSWLFAAVVVGLLLVAAVGPSHLKVTNPADPSPELVFSFRAFGELIHAEQEQVFDPSRPVHMQGRSTAKPERHPVTVRLTVDGVTLERSYRARGISRDGPAIDEWRLPLATGMRQVEIELFKGDEVRFTWSGNIEAQKRRLHVITYEPDSGFRLE